MLKITKLLIVGLVVAATLYSPSMDARANARKTCCQPPPPPPQTVVLSVCHPCTDCKHEISVCIPACCKGTPTVCFERTLIGHGKSVFTWACGHHVIVRYTHQGGYRVVQRS